MSAFTGKTKRPKRYRPDRLDASSITPEVVAEWWSPRFGDANPRRMNNPLWEWLVRTRVDAYAARERFGFPSPWDENRPGPAWCFARLGQSVTHLPDGRIVMIAGEHEDGYDPDFQIYNDVTVQHPDGSLDLYGYPKDIFPPTDFHTATLAGDRIVVIGSNGYDIHGTFQATQVAELNLNTWAMRLISTHGVSPGWLHNHDAELSDDGHSILVRGGLIQPEGGDFHGFIENPDTWSLDLRSWEWRRISRTSWETYVFYSEGVRVLWISNFQMLPWDIKYGHGMSADEDDIPPGQLVPEERRPEFQRLFGHCNPYAQAAAARLYRKGFTPDLEVIQSLYRPELPHTVIPEKDDDNEDDGTEESGEAFDENGPFDWDEDDFSRTGVDFDGTRIEVQGVTVRYREETARLIMVIEGELPPETVAALISDLTVKLESLLNRPVTVKRL